MNNKPASPDQITQRFEVLPWHDAKLMSLSFCRREANDEDEVVATLVFQRDGGWQRPSKLTFKESTLIDMQVDLEGKRVCSDSIASASCSLTSDWIRSLSDQNPHDSFEGFLHFRISLIPPGGSVNILAKDFVFEPT